MVSQAAYVACPVCIIFDPAGMAKSQHDELTSFDVIKIYGFMALAAPTNRLAPRLNAVERFLTEARGRHRSDADQSGASARRWSRR